MPLAVGTGGRAADTSKTIGALARPWRVLDAGQNIARLSACGGEEKLEKETLQFGLQCITTGVGEEQTEAQPLDIIVLCPDRTQVLPKVI